MDDPLNLKQYIRTVNDFPIKGIKFRDITSLIETPIAFSKTCKELSKISRDFKPNIIIGIESRGFVFAGSIAIDLLIPFVMARKPNKLPNETFKIKFELEYGKTSLEIQKNTKIDSSKNIVVIDDLIATGGTALACSNLLNKNFGVPKENILILAVIDLPYLGGSEKIKNFGYKINTLVSY